ncbi:hypothetical protein [Candidatus Magnetobacterium casense]|uniref:Uncharacterized protein n=1 Tax=Candidatus Magnetobacterium casense TaxID=1455061 RepID=A0ABS6RU14_9BACT|nr:hypothetical protein [Candidatus Magnetobacterium casensis]MBV6340112.1 hypothetical protein [Candidatus Magnetobacterium casensis]
MYWVVYKDKDGNYNVRQTSPDYINYIGGNPAFGWQYVGAFANSEDANAYIKNYLQPASAPSAPTASAAEPQIKFKAGLSAAQQQSIITMLKDRKSRGEPLNETDAKNFAYAIGDENYKQYVGMSADVVTSWSSGAATGTQGQTQPGTQNQTQPSTDQKMAPDQVTQIFRSMGYEPSQADISYWTQQPMAASSTLYETLYQKKQGATTQNQNVETAGVGQIFMRGTQALVKFSDDPDGPGPANATTVWLVDSTTQTMRPFLSEQAFNNYYAGVTDLATETTKGTIATLPTTVLTSPGSTFYQYKLLPDAQGIQNNGSVPGDGNAASEASISKLYGRAYSEEAQKAAFNILDNWLGVLKSTPGAGLSSSLIDGILNNPTKVAFYVNALAYGGYGVNDVYRDLKRQSLADSGRSDMSSMVVIHATQDAQTYYNSTAGKVIRTNPDLKPPASIGDINTSLLDLSIYDLPTEAFKTLVQPLDWTSEAAKEEAAQIKSAYHDVLMKQLEAQTDQEKAIADYEYELFKKELSRTFGIELSNNVQAAWNQIEALTSGYTSAGLGDSGLQTEAIDNELAVVRRKDEELRQSKLTSEEEAKRKYYLTSATPEEIAQLSNEQLQAWGLKPSQEVINFLSVENLMSTYDLSEKEAQEYHDLTLDNNGNYRSNLYKNLFANKYGVQKAKESYQLDQLIQKYLNNEEKAYAELVKSGSLTSGYLGDTTPGTGTKATTPSPAVQQPGTVETTPLGQAAQAAKGAGGLWQNAQGVIINPANYGYITEEDLRAQGFSPVGTTTGATTMPSAATTQPSAPNLSNFNAYGLDWKPGLSDAQKQSIMNLLANKDINQWNDTDWKNFNYAVTGMNGQPVSIGPGGTTATSLGQASQAAAAAGNISQSIGSSIPFKQGLSTAQQQSISNLVANKPQNQWTTTDWANYNYATGQSPANQAAITPASVSTTPLGQATTTQQATSAMQSLTNPQSTMGQTWQKGSITIDLSKGPNTPYGYFTPEDLRAQGFTQV